MPRRSLLSFTTGGDRSINGIQWGDRFSPLQFGAIARLLGFKGARSDSKRFEQTQAELPEDLRFIGDKAYVGRFNTTTPHKNPPQWRVISGTKGL